MKDKEWLQFLPRFSVAIVAANLMQKREKQNMVNLFYKVFPNCRANLFLI